MLAEENECMGVNCGDNQHNLKNGIAKQKAKRIEEPEQREQLACFDLRRCPEEKNSKGRNGDQTQEAMRV